LQTAPETLERQYRSGQSHYVTEPVVPSTHAPSLLRARVTFMRDAYLNPADFDENRIRAIACEVLARRIVHTVPSERMESVMSTRFRYKDNEGDTSAPVSTLETAIDHHCTVSLEPPVRSISCSQGYMGGSIAKTHGPQIFLASTEAQFVINSLWKGDWVQENNENEDIDYVPYDHASRKHFWAHLDPQRMSVPRYQSLFKIAMWIVFLFGGAYLLLQESS
jgi:hypothetical protein